MTGSQHISRGLGCDDAFAYGHVGDFIVAAVADGAGSVSGTSAWGSYSACQAVLSFVMHPAFIASFRSASATDAEAMMRWLFTCARDSVTKQAEGMGVSVGLLATTLSVAIASKELLVLGQIGDGIIASESADGIATHLIEEKDEYANATWFIHSDEAFEKSFRASAHVGATAFALSTDGMSYKITDIVTGEPFEPFFKGAWQRVRSGAGASDFAALLRGIEDDQTGDDKTMVLAAMRRVDDEYYPSARPIFRSEVSSPPPPARPAVMEAAPAPKEPAQAQTDAPTPLDASAEEPSTAPLNDQAEKGRHRWRRRRTNTATTPLESEQAH
ncbi:PP2C family serine/threonine-protein phosphatase [Mycolicibacterium sp. XJ647]